MTLLNFCSIFGAGVMQFFAGRVISWQADASSPASYRLLFITYALLLFIAMMIYLFSKDARPKP